MYAVTAKKTIMLVTAGVLLTAVSAFGGGNSAITAIDGDNRAEQTVPYPTRGFVQPVTVPDSEVPYPTRGRVEPAEAIAAEIPYPTRGGEVTPELVAEDTAEDEFRVVQTERLTPTYPVRGRVAPLSVSPTEVPYPTRGGVTPDELPDAAVPYPTRGTLGVTVR